MSHSLENGEAGLNIMRFIKIIEDEFCLPSEHLQCITVVISNFFFTLFWARVLVYNWVLIF